MDQWADLIPGENDDEILVSGYRQPSPEQVQFTTKRMYSRTDLRCALAMYGRENVLKNSLAE